MLHRLHLATNVPIASKVVLQSVKVLDIDVLLELALAQANRHRLVLVDALASKKSISAVCLCERQRERERVNRERVRLPYLGEEDREHGDQLLGRAERWNHQAVHGLRHHDLNDELRWNRRKWPRWLYRQIVARLAFHPQADQLARHLGVIVGTELRVHT